MNEISKFEEEDFSKDINKIINKYSSKIIDINNNTIKKLIDNKDSEFTSQYSKRTKNSSNFSEKINKNNNIIQIDEEDINKNISSSLVNKPIKTDSNIINQKEIEINIENNNININTLNKKEEKINHHHIFNKNMKNKQNILFSLKNNYKIDKNNSSIYDTSFNKLFNPSDNGKFCLDNKTNINLLKDKNSSNIIKKIMNLEEKQIVKEKKKKNLKEDNKKEINHKDKKYINKLFKKKTKKKNRSKIINKNKTSRINYNIKKKKCKFNLLSIIRNILIFLIATAAIVFYSFVFSNFKK